MRKWTQLVGGVNIAEIQKQMREDGDDYVSNAMQDYIKQRYDLCPAALVKLLNQQRNN